MMHFDVSVILVGILLSLGLNQPVTNDEPKTIILQAHAYEVFPELLQPSENPHMSSPEETDQDLIDTLTQELNSF